MMGPKQYLLIFYIYLCQLLSYSEINFNKIMDYIVLINVIVSLSILNVWLLRFNNQTPYRGGDSNNLKEEFHVYGEKSEKLYLILVSKSN